MPFTVAHAAAAAPIWYVLGRRLVLSALVIGCLSPDFEYFIQLKMRRTIGHQWHGLLLLDLPVALLALWLLHRILKRPLLLLLPQRLAHLRSIGAGRFEFFPLGRFCNICVSILIGAASHIAWDSMTHPNGWVVQRVAFFRHTLPAGTPLEKPVYVYLQHGGGMLGLAFLLLWAVHALQRVPMQPAQQVLPLKTRVAVLLLLGSSTLAAGVANALVGYGSGSDPIALKRALVGGVVGAISGVVVSMLVYAAIAKTLRWELSDVSAKKPSA